MSRLIQVRQHKKEMDRECYEEEVQPYQKMDYRPIIILMIICMCVVNKQVELLEFVFD